MRALFNVFARIWRFFIGLLFQGVKAAEKSNPKAVLEAEVDKYNTSSADFNKGLGEQAGMVNRLKTQIAKQSKAIDGYTARLKSLVTFAVGTPEHGKALSLAAKLKQTKVDKVENEAQLAQAQAMYEKLTKQRNAFQKDAQDRIDNARRLISKAEMAEAQAKLATMASNASFSPSGSGLADLEESLEQRAASAQGQVQVAQDASDASPWALTAAEQEAEESSALDEFMAECNTDDAPKTEV